MNQTIATGLSISFRGDESNFAYCSSALIPGALRAAMLTGVIDYSTRLSKRVGGTNES